MKYIVIVTILMMATLTACETPLLEHTHPEHTHPEHSHPVLEHTHPEHSHPVLEHTHPEHSHPVLEHTHDLNFDDLLPVPDPEQSGDLNLDNLLKIIDDSILAVNLMDDIVVVAAEDREKAKKLYQDKVVTVRAAVESVEFLDPPKRNDPPIHAYHLKNVQDIVFYIETYPPLNRLLIHPNPEILFEPGQTYTFTLFIEHIGTTRWPLRGLKIVAKLFEEE